ncbi:hypothetical protein WD_0823 [Wolbachia endosymbiont of Drosophila melanogaster]|uniref:hypothetical protein n=1 Tax=Wolbachia TaxID=953 RepID=UPI000023BB38|nr:MULTISPECIES: hypothetical protein [Wolbachia]AAS14510.1 hypothetical protein WD_0823 [Wolbachia endosymbiont of Drosophila melanogaster]ERN55493.1 hypothetical protein WMELPOP_04396 [Wolbachia pipientis wMelPop]MCE4149677.1 hypothetical protein [Wolbachia endosymbiont of Drosophila melanogaster]MCE4151065.1 hypothetical protein [Wolbachia endosymbiont of Drosophila melanogaster]POG49892.1 hypothetical protein BK222_03345 [Wolbachia sp. wMel_AMD]
MNGSTPKEKENRIVTLRAQAEKFGFSRLRAGKDNAEANSGATMYVDLPRMKLVIQNKVITKELVDELYNKHTNLISNDKNKYRQFVKQVFTELFEYAEAEVPNDSILEELITNCNQAAYVGALYGKGGPILHLAETYGLLFQSNHVTHINCSDPSHAAIRIEEKIAVRTFAELEEELCKLDSSLEFTLKSQGDKNVTYEDGKLSLTVPKRLKDYNIGDKNLFDVIKECFQKFCERLGFFKIKIEHGLDKPPKVNSHLENMEPPIHSNEYGNTPGN